METDKRVATPTYTVFLLFGVANSVTRLGDFLDFGQVFKAFGNK